MPTQRISFFIRVSGRSKYCLALTFCPFMSAWPDKTARAFQTHIFACLCTVTQTQKLGYQLWLRHQEQMIVRRPSEN